MKRYTVKEMLDVLRTLNGDTVELTPIVVHLINEGLAKFASGAPAPEKARVCKTELGIKLIKWVD